MGEHGVQRLLTWAWALLVVSSALYFLGDHEADNDLWMHLYSGQRILAESAVPRVDDASYTAAGLPWVDHEWLSQIGLATLYSAGGSTALWVAKLAIALLTALLVWSMVRRHARSPWVRGAVMVLVLAAMARGYAVRPQIVTYLGVAALLAWLDRPRRAAPDWTTFAGLGAAFGLWANAHGAVIAGLGILGSSRCSAARSTTACAGSTAPRCSSARCSARVSTRMARRCSPTSPTSCADRTRSASGSRSRSTIRRNGRPW